MKQHLHRFWQVLREKGASEAVRLALLQLLIRPQDLIPLSRSGHLPLFDGDTAALRLAAKKKRAEQLGLIPNAPDRFPQWEEVARRRYPETFTHQGRTLRYAHIPASRESRGLMVSFHAHDHLHPGSQPLPSWPYWDLLAPLDEFGWQQRGSWFWGEHGIPFVQEITAELIQEQVTRLGGRPWFCFGSCMGGFAAINLGLRLGCHGLYTIAPQINLRAIVREKTSSSRNNAYGALIGENPEAIPNLMDRAQTMAHLPPLFLVQSLYDPLAPFSDHAYRLLEVYHQRKSWYGLRIHPSCSHEGDASLREADWYFSRLLKARRGAPPP